MSTVWLAGFDYQGNLVVESFDVDVTAKLVRRAKQENGARPPSGFGLLGRFKSQLDRDRVNWSRDEALACLANEIAAEVESLDRRKAAAVKRLMLVTEAQVSS